MKIIWVHTFNPKIKNSGVFMYEFLKAFEGEGNIEIELFYLGSIGNILQLCRNIFALFSRRDGYDLIHCQYGSFCSLVCGFLPGKKIMTLRGSDLFQLSIGTVKERLHSKLAVFFSKISLVRYDKIIVMSKQMKEMLPSKYHTKTTVIPDPIDLTKFQEQDKLHSRKMFFPDFDEHDILILFTSISSGNPIKRYELAYNIVKRLNEIDGNREFQLVSASDFSNSDMKYVFSAADICLLTSIYEGFPNCIKESVACNTPFVATNVSDLKDIAIKTNNCFVCKDDIDEFAKKILLSLALPREEIRKQIGFLSLPNIKNELINLYELI